MNGGGIDPPDFVEWVVYVSLIIGALVVIWRFGPVAWLRDRIADEAAGRFLVRVQPNIDAALAAARAADETVLTEVRAVGELVRQHRTESAAQHQADLELREERQGDIDAVLEELRSGHQGILGRLSVVESVLGVEPPAPPSGS